MKKSASSALRTADLNLDAFHRGQPPMSMVLSHLHRLLTVHLVLLLQLLLFGVDVCVLVWLLPTNLGEASPFTSTSGTSASTLSVRQLAHQRTLQQQRPLRSRHHILFDRDYAIPDGLPRYLFLALLALSLLLQLGVGAWYEGVRVAWRGQLAEIMRYAPGRQVDGMLNWKHWRFYRYLWNSLPGRDLQLGWIVRSMNDWKRFFIIRIPLAILFASALISLTLQQHQLLPEDDDRIDQSSRQAVHYAVLSYLSIKLLLFLVDLLGKLAALFLWFCGLQQSLSKFTTLDEEFQTAMEEQARSIMKHVEWAAGRYATYVGGDGRYEASSGGSLNSQSSVRPDHFLGRNGSRMKVWEGFRKGDAATRTQLEGDSGSTAASNAASKEGGSIGSKAGIVTAGKMHPIPAVDAARFSKEPSLSHEPSLPTPSNIAAAAQATTDNKSNDVIFEAGRDTIFTVPASRWSIITDEEGLREAGQEDGDDAAMAKVGPKTPLLHQDHD